ncbi:hypothetical protein L9F63_020231 [Diploptera punctata]|uniref:KIF-binding protein n=1 Tax=Diploptera punctata TaxID=6984 RepID=A0AAD7ZTF5_DIPPU|nr:hypothetical protein L9F63_020231 [Diploptera punctata]
MEVIVFKTLHDQYNRLKSLQKNDKVGKETEPAWSVNEAKILLDTMINNINNLMLDFGKDHEIYYRLLGMKGTLMYEEAKFLINIENELQGQEIMYKALELLKDYFMKSEITFLILRIVNHYSFLLLKQGDFDKPLKLLENADQMYNELKSKIVDPIFYTADDIFLPSTSLNPKKDTSEKVGRFVTNNLLMLGFVHVKKGNYDKYAFYNHKVLNRQLVNRQSEPAAWAMKAVKLASYFITKQRFREARNHLAAACHVLEENETELKNSEPNEANIQKWEEVQLRFSDIAKCWVQYGLFLFGVSKSKIVSLFYGEPSQFLDNLWLPPYDVNPSNVFSKGHNSQMTEEKQDLAAKNIQDSNINNVQQNSTCVSEDLQSKLTANQDQVTMEDQIFKITTYRRNIIPSNELKQCTNSKQCDKFEIIFAGLGSKDSGSIDETQNSSEATQKVENKKDTQQNKQIEDKNLLLFSSLDLSAREKQVTVDLIENAEQARELFLHTHSWLKQSKMYFTLKDNPMEYVNAILDLSELYKYLAFFEEDLENQYSVQKRRADALETLSTVLREVRPQCYMAVSIELLRELAEVQLEMMGLNLRRLYMAQETHVHGSAADFTLHKMEAMADIHSRLEQFGDSLGHRAEVGDGLSEISPSEISEDSLPHYT